MRHRQGKVPRCDAGTDAEGVEHQRRGDILIVHRFRGQRLDQFVEGVVERCSTVLGFSDALRQRLAHLAGQQCSQFLGGLDQRFSEGAHPIGTLFQRELSPGGLCRPRSGDHIGNLSDGRDGESSHLFFSGRVERDEDAIFDAVHRESPEEVVAGKGLDFSFAGRIAAALAAAGGVSSWPAAHQMAP